MIWSGEFSFKLKSLRDGNPWGESYSVNNLNESGRYESQGYFSENKIPVTDTGITDLDIISDENLKWLV